MYYGPIPPIILPPLPLCIPYSLAPPFSPPPHNVTFQTLIMQTSAWPWTYQHSLPPPHFTSNLNSHSPLDWIDYFTSQTLICIITSRFIYTLLQPYTVHNVQCTQCILYDVHSVHCMMYTVQCTLYDVHYTTYNILRTLYTVHSV